MSECTDGGGAGFLDLGQSDLPVRELFRDALGGNLPRRSAMLKTVVIGTTALFLTASAIANAQSSQTSSTAPATPQRLNATDRNTLTDMRVDLVKAALQLTPEQEKYWPAVESAIRAGAEDRRGRIARIQETVGMRADEGRVEALRNRDPIAFLQRRSQALAQRSADLDKLAEAWQPLYNTLSQEQRQRLAALSIFVLHEMSDVVDRRRAAQPEDNQD
jgi:LTXXQ motif family protein